MAAKDAASSDPSLGGVISAERARLNELATAVIQAARALVAKLDECRPHIDGAFQMAYTVRGGKYRGPNYAKELEDLRGAIKAVGD